MPNMHTQARALPSAGVSAGSRLGQVFKFAAGKTPVAAPRLCKALRVTAQSRRSSDAGSEQGSSKNTLIGGIAAAVLLLGGAAQANEKIAEFDTSGFIFKDSVQIVQLEDPAVSGVTIYLTDYKRSLTERLGRDPFSDPSMASITCVPTGTVAVNDLDAARKQQEIFAERKTFNLLQSKALRVRRIYDESNQVVIYVAYSTRFNSANDETERGFSSRYRTSVCAVPLARQLPEAPPLEDVPVAE